MRVRLDDLDSGRDQTGWRRSDGFDESTVVWMDGAIGAEWLSG
jgi:hypothetical protein